MKTISKAWIKKKYWDEQVTVKEMAKLRKVSTYHIEYLIIKYGLQKRKNGIKPKGKSGYVMPEVEKIKHREQLHAKEILAYKGKRFIGNFKSITSAAKELNLSREHIRDILNKNKPRWTTKGYTFKPRKFRGEIIIERRESIDFSKDIKAINRMLNASLPPVNKELAIKHYNKKLRKCWR